MREDQSEILKDLVSGAISAEQGELRLGPGCSLQSKTETEEVWEPDKLVKHKYRTCHRISGCTDPNQNTDWLCGDWGAPE